MSITSSIEPMTGISFFDPEDEETQVPSLGYSAPPPGFGEATGQSGVAEDPDDDALLDAALGRDRRQLLVATLAICGLALGVIAALLI